MKVKRKGVYMWLQRGGEIPRLAPNKLVEVLRSSQGWEMELGKGYLFGIYGRTQICDMQPKFSLQALQDLQASLDRSPVLRKAGLKQQFSFKIK